MSSTEELPEHQFFHIIRQGEQDAFGPFSQTQLVELLNAGHIKSEDWVYYDALPDWTPLSEVFDLHERVINYGEEGQDPQVVEAAFGFVTGRSEPGEEIYFIATQHQPALSLTAAVLLSSPSAIVLTNHRVCIIKQKVIGESEMDDYSIELIKEGIKRIKVGDKVGKFNLVLKSGEWVEIGKIPIAQLDRLEELTNAVISGEVNVATQ